MVTAATAARLEFFLGTVNVNARGGARRPQTAGLFVLPGDTVRTDTSGQAELSVGPYTRMDLDHGSEVAVERVGAAEGERRVTQFTQRSGTVWYRVVYNGRAERFTVATPFGTATAAGSGADFMLQVEAASLRAHALDGVLLLTRPDGSEAVNLAAGQSATVWSDSRPFQVGRTSADVSAGRLFAGLQQNRATAAQPAVDQPISLVFSTLPQMFYFITVQFTTLTVQVVQVPAETSVEPYAQGFTTLAQASLLGGGPFLASLMQQLLGVPVDRYCMLGSTNLLQLAATLGNVTVPVDEKAAAFMGLKPGLQPLNPDRLLTFMKPRISGFEDSRQRQRVVLRALFDAVRGKSIVVTALLADRAITTMQTNFTPAEVVNDYRRFAAREGWVFKTSVLPGSYVTTSTGTVYQPDIDGARRLLSGE